MATFYECDRCGDLFKSTDLNLYLQSSYIRRNFGWDKSSVELCPECQKPFMVFLLGFISKTNKNFRVDWNQEKIYNTSIK